MDIKGNFRATLYDRRIEENSIGILPVVALSALTGGLIFAVAKTGWLSTIFAPFIVIAGGAVLFASWRDWQLGIKSLLIIVIFEGAVRKWFLSSANELVYFYKDLVMLASLLGYFMQRKKPFLIIVGRLKIVFAITVTLLFYSIALIANPRASHPLISLLGIKSYFLYIPLAVMVPRMFVTKEKVVDFLRWFLILCLPVIFLGVMQFVSADAASSINKYAWDAVQQEMGPDASSIASFEDSAGNSYVRVTGTFSYISGMAIYLPIAYALLLGFFSLESFKYLQRTFRWIYYSIFAGVVGTAFMTGSRSTVVALVIITLAFFGLTAHRNLKQRLAQFFIMGGIALIALTFIFPAAFDALKTRAFGSEEQIEEGSGRITGEFSLPIEEAYYAGAFGYGIGATQNYVPALVNKLELSNWGESLPPVREDEQYRVMLELGIVGFVLYCLMRFSLILMLWKTCFSIEDTDSRSVGIAISAVLTIGLFTGGGVIVHTQNVFQWFLIGVCMSLANGEALQRDMKTPSVNKMRAQIPRLHTSLAANR